VGVEMKYTKEYCKQGHLLAETRQIEPSGASYCRVCKNDRQNKYRKLHPERYNRVKQTSVYKLKYGISYQDFLRVIEEQGYKCKLCGDEVKENGKSTHIDHDHKTGKFRAILCHHCNTGLGMFRDSIELLDKAKVYLQDHEIKS
jgi:hypothetical protein